MTNNTSNNRFYSSIRPICFSAVKDAEIMEQQKKKKKNVFKTNARDKCLKNFITAQIVRWRFSGSGKPRTLYFIWLRFVLCADKCSLVVAGCYLRAARQDWKKYASFGRFVFFACVTLPTEANLPSGMQTLRIQPCFSLGQRTQLFLSLPWPCTIVWGRGMFSGEALRGRGLSRNT